MHDADEREFEGRSFGLGILLGAALGASAALLMAPASGQKTRRRLRRGAERLYADGGERLGRLRSGSEERLSALWEEADLSARRLRRALQRKARSSLSAVRR